MRIIPHFRLLVTGGRDYDDYPTLKKVLNRATMWADRITLVTGACSTGADALAERWAHSLHLLVERWHADWHGPLGRGAGPARNTEMVKAGADYAVVVWDGVSAGTGDCFGKIKKAGIPYKLVRY